ncbi:MAG: methyltransferase [Nocardiopsaceae bacterium]|jgi:SAM-dependent methyltransferase|nr:methyltransferase [Nocardiopsaceae bacterium]
MPAPKTGDSSAEHEEIAAARRMHELITRSLLVQAVFVACRLGIPDLLAASAKTAEELAAATGAQAAALRRLLRALTGLEVVAVEDDRFALTSLGRSLRAGPHSVAESATFFGTPAVWSAWGALGDAVIDGEAAFRHVHGTDAFGYWSAHPDEMAAFQAFMSAQSRLQIPAVLSAYDFTPARTIVDVGGGQGALLAALLAVNTSARGVLFDRPDVVAGSGPVLAPVASRCQVAPGDFFRTVTAGADTYVLKHVLHDWDDARAASILRNIHDAIIPGGRLITIETVMPSGNEYHHAKFLDINMLVLSEGGLERTDEEYRALLDEAGFTLTRVVPTPAALSVVEAISR